MFAQIVKAVIGDRLIGKTDNLRYMLKRILESLWIGRNIKKNYFIHLKSLRKNLWEILWF